MNGKVDDGVQVTVEPVDPDPLAVGGIVVVRVHGTDSLLRVKAVDRGRFLIGNHGGGTHGRASRRAIFGRATRIE